MIYNGGSFSNPVQGTSNKLVFHLLLNQTYFEFADPPKSHPSCGWSYRSISLDASSSNAVTNQSQRLHGYRGDIAPRANILGVCLRQRCHRTSAHSSVCSRSQEEEGGIPDPRTRYRRSFSWASPSRLLQGSVLFSLAMNAESNRMLLNIFSHSILSSHLFSVPPFSSSYWSLFSCHCDQSLWIYQRSKHQPDDTPMLDSRYLHDG